MDRFEHVYLSLTRLYMTLLMVALMAVLMLRLMRPMYPDKQLNALIGTSVLVFGLALAGLRTQEREIAQMKRILARNK